MSVKILNAGDYRSEAAPTRSTEAWVFDGQPEDVVEKMWELMVDAFNLVLQLSQHGGLFGFVV